MSLRTNCFNLAMLFLLDIAWQRMYTEMPTAGPVTYKSKWGQVKGKLGEIEIGNLYASALPERGVTVQFMHQRINLGKYSNFQKKLSFLNEISWEINEILNLNLKQWEEQRKHTWTASIGPVFYIFFCKG